MSNERLEVSKTVDASPERLFALLTDPTRHQEIDSSQMLRGTGDTRLTGLGDQFVMRMHNPFLGDYQMRNTVTAYTENRVIGWGPELYPLDGYTEKLGDTKATGHTYTWRLEPAGTGTAVTVVYDWSGVADERFKAGFPLLDEQRLGESIDRAAHAAS